MWCYMMWCCLQAPLSFQFVKNKNINGVSVSHLAYNHPLILSCSLTHSRASTTEPPLFAKTAAPRCWWSPALVGSGPCRTSALEIRSSLWRWRRYPPGSQRQHAGEPCKGANQDHDAGGEGSHVPRWCWSASTLDPPLAMHEAMHSRDLAQQWCRYEIGILNEGTMGVTIKWTIISSDKHGSLSILYSLRSKISSLSILYSLRSKISVMVFFNLN